jgi:hypothetical protein
MKKISGLYLHRFITDCMLVITSKFILIESRKAMQGVVIWSYILSQTDLVFDEWWEKTNMAASGITKRGLNSLIILGAWTIWNHRNKCVFDGINPNMAEALILLEEEH